MKKLSFLLPFVFSFFAVSCNLVSDGFNASIQDFFDENLGEARITHYSLPDQAGWSNENNGYLHIPSRDEFSIKLYLSNPQGYKFILGKNLCIDWQNEAISEIFADQDLFDTLVKLYSDESDKTNSTLILTFSKEFLLKCEMSGVGVDISPVIKMSHPLSDVPFQSYSALKLRANSAPPPVSGITIYECPDPDEENKKRYLFAFNMPSRADLLGIHRDISKIAIKIEDEDGDAVFSDEWNVRIADDGSFAFLNEQNEGDACFKYEDLTHNYTPVRTEFHSSNPVMYFSDVSITSYPVIVCYITLYDSNGLKNEGEASETTRIQYLDSVTVTNRDSVVEDGARLEQDDGERETFATIILTPPVTAHDGNDNSFNIPDQQDKIEVFYEVYEGEDAAGKRILSGSGSGKQPLKLPVGSLFIKAYAHLSGYEDSNPIEYRVQVSKTKLVVDANNGDDGNVGSKDSPFKTILGALQAFDDITNEKNTIILESSIAEGIVYNNENACFTILSQPQYYIQNGVSVTAQSLSLEDITIVGSIDFTGKNLTLGNVYEAGPVKVAMKENGSSLSLTEIIGITEVELGAAGQSIVLKEDFTLHGDPKSPIKISLADSYKTGDVILISEAGSLTSDSLKNFELDSENFRIELKAGTGVLVSKDKTIISEEGASIELPDGVKEVEFGAPGQSIVVEPGSVPSGGDPIKITLGDESQYQEGDPILKPKDEDNPLTEEDLKNFELDSEDYIIKIEDGKGVLAKKSQNIEITLPGVTMPTRNCVFTLGGEGVSGTEENTKVKRNKLISFSVTKDGAELSDDNAEFEISLMQNGTIVEGGGGYIKGEKSLQVPGYVPLGSYEIKMSVKIDGVLIGEQTLSVEVVE